MIVLMMKKTNKKKTKLKSLSPLTAFFFVVAWIVLITIFVHSPIIDQFSQSLKSNSINQLIIIVLLVPIALISFPVLYNTNINQYIAERKTAKNSFLSRIFFSLVSVIVILIVSWYLFFLIDTVIYFLV